MTIKRTLDNLMTGLFHDFRSYNAMYPFSCFDNYGFEEYQCHWGVTAWRSLVLVSFICLFSILATLVALLAICLWPVTLGLAIIWTLAFTAKWYERQSHEKSD